MPIDFHQHIMVPTEYDAGNARVGEHVVAHIDAHGGGKAVVLPLAKGNSTAMAKEKWGKDQTAMRTDYALQAYDRFPDTIIPFCHVDPLHPDALDEIHRYHEAGCMGFGEHKVRLPVDHPDSLDIYELCGKLGWVVLLHFEYRNYNYNFEVFDQVLESFPDTVFVAHAQAWWANVSAEVPRDWRAEGYTSYPPGPVVRGGLSDQWLSKYPNLYGDLSAGSGLNAISRDPEFGAEFVNRHWNQLLWATDCHCLDGKGNWESVKPRPCFASQTLPLLKEYCETEEKYHAITQGNAERVLGL